MEGISFLARFAQTHETEDDARLMLRVREGDDTSFALLLERHRRPVARFMYRMVQNQAISEELAHARV